MAAAKGKFDYKTGQIVVVGTSAGGMDALSALIRQLPEDFPAPVLAVMHISADATGNALLNALNKSSKLTCVHAVHGEPAEAGKVYFAPSDHHLLIEKKGRIHVTKGAQENRNRPGIDPSVPLGRGRFWQPGNRNYSDRLFR